MPVTDPIADMLTRIRNANRVEADEVRIPVSQLKIGLAKILREEGFIKHYKVVRPGEKSRRGRDRDRDRARQEKEKPVGPRGVLLVFLKYGPAGEPVLNGLRRISKPGLRKYVKASEIPLIEGGLGITILSTSSGLLAGSMARRRNIGGELLCAVW